MLDAAARALRLLPAETAHRLTISLTRIFEPFLPQRPEDDPRLAVEVFGLQFPNPVGLAAGFDKDAEVPSAMLRLGFGFVECGTVTPRPQSGNPRPRLFRLTEDRAVINRMGFNNRGMESSATRLSGRRASGLIGINIGANKQSPDRIADYVRAFECLARHADYVAINVSSPNTPGLRGLQGREDLDRLVTAVSDARARSGHYKPLLIKIAPDLDEREMDAIANVVLKSQVEGLIVSNTTIARPRSLRSRYAHEQGGLSGRPLFEPSTRVLAQMRARVGPRITLVGTGGIASGADAYAKIRAGATLVQLYTALAFEGPGLVKRVKRELADCLTRDGYMRVTDAVGADVRSGHVEFHSPTTW